MPDGHYVGGAASFTRGVSIPGSLRRGMPVIGWPRWTERASISFNPRLAEARDAGYCIWLLITLLDMMFQSPAR